VLSLERDGAVETMDCSRELDKQSYAQWFVDLFARFAGTLDEGAASGAAQAARDDVVQVATLLQAAYCSAEISASVPLDFP
jgi:hypothetical protein